MLLKNGHTACHRLPEPYRDVKHAPRDAYKHQQFAAGSLKSDTSHAWVGEVCWVGCCATSRHGCLQGLPYEDRLMYAKLGLDKVRNQNRTYMCNSEKITQKLGFGSSDWPKRDEFSHPIRMLQYRETLKVLHRARNIIIIQPTRGRLRRGSWLRGHLPILRHPRGPQHGQRWRRSMMRCTAHKLKVRSMIAESTDGVCTHLGEARWRLPKDTCNPTALGPVRRAGPLRSAYAKDFESHHVAYVRPTHARKPLIRDAFVRKNDVGLHLDPVSLERKWLTYQPQFCV